jgi:hypothetical protein
LCFGGAPNFAIPSLQASFRRELYFTHSLYIVKEAKVKTTWSEMFFTAAGGAKDGGGKNLAGVREPRFLLLVNETCCVV